MSTEKTKNGIIQQHADDSWEKLRSASGPQDLLASHEKSIRTILGLSPFVADIAQSKPAILTRILQQGWHQQIDMDTVCQAFHEQINGIDSEENLLVTLRLFRAEQMAALAWRDLTNQQSIQTSLTQTSLLADIGRQRRRVPEHPLA